MSTVISSSSLIINSRWLGTRTKHKFFRAEASRDILKIRVSEMGFPGVFKRYFPLWMSCCFLRIHARPGNMQCRQNVPYAFKDIARFERFTDLNLLEYAFNVIQNWETDALKFYLMVLIFC